MRLTCATIEEFMALAHTAPMAITKDNGDGTYTLFALTLNVVFEGATQADRDACEADGVALTEFNGTIA